MISAPFPGYYLRLTVRLAVKWTYSLTISISHTLIPNWERDYGRFLICMFYTSASMALTLSKDIRTDEHNSCLQNDWQQHLETTLNTFWWEIIMWWYYTRCRERYDINSFEVKMYSWYRNVHDRLEGELQGRLEARKSRKTIQGN